MDHMKAAFDTWNYEGIELPVFVKKDVLLGPVKDFEVKDDDVWLCTYPKSGTHFTMQMLNLLQFDGDFAQLNKHTESIPRGPGPFGVSVPQADGSTQHTHEYFGSLPSPRMIVTHLPFHLLPTQVFEKKAKVIYVARNPKDAAVSFYHFIQPSMKAFGKDFEWNDFIERYMSDKAHIGPWHSHVLPFWKRRADENVLFLKFEEMKMDKYEAVKKIAKFVGKAVTEDLLNKVVENSSLKKTKEAMDSEHYRSGTTSAAKLGSFVRKGTIGDWKNEFTVAQSQQYDMILEKALKGSGLVMQFE
ncbi:sulfotransferase 1C4-like [Antedon mediterranea]|uniref:sulfotransferase 1C4-like n=1 Tax=Antedon mediterranea TaxID=105859 RepID=UPI003AF5D7D2